ncbi:ABC transporter ATP-binding protein [Candidatus Methanocrinis natronophilus]|uniref:ABC transporter ATP-binding protein n=1 Tax=Candidatus Methanocrinis natronophilus TaxID=3033396 RepID=A0ABT5X9C5_9EURY|nr:ABC transporter ATP-binding protein [Candidatus Methanocrinis natronophilus]MDF0591303.1 ABC transporter ATP-binding protein [Candidatus Methanocrinis natronophilus]
MDPMIETEDLSKVYGNRAAVDDLNLVVDRGEAFGFLGPNGAGKTTTIRILSTLTRPSSGRAWINGFDVLEEPGKVKEVFGIVQQHMSLHRELTVRENLQLHGRLHHIEKKERERRIDEILDYAGLGEHSDHLIERLSGGMARRAMIARALLHKPRLLFLDEPTVGLDAQARRKIWDLIRGMKSDGATVFLTTHYIEEAEALCDRVGIIHQGRLIALDSPIELRRSLGLFTVESRRRDNETEYRYFPDRTAATEAVKALPPGDNVVMRESNLEDVFVELTGRKVTG